MCTDLRTLGFLSLSDFFLVSRAPHSSLVSYSITSCAHQQHTATSPSVTYAEVSLGGNRQTSLLQARVTRSFITQSVHSSSMKTERANISVLPSKATLDPCQTCTLRNICVHFHGPNGKPRQDFSLNIELNVKTSSCHDFTSASQHFPVSTATSFKRH